MANLLKEVIAQQGTSQRALARKIGMPESSLSRIVNGRGCHTTTAQRIAAALEVPVDAIFPADEAA